MINVKKKTNSEGFSKQQSVLHEKGHKVVVSDLDLDAWLAQSLGLDIKNIPIVKPAHVPRAAFDHLKKYAKVVKEKKKPLFNYKQQETFVPVSDKIKLDFTEINELFGHPPSPPKIRQVS